MSLLGAGCGERVTPPSSAPGRMLSPESRTHTVTSRMERARIELPGSVASAWPVTLQPRISAAIEAVHVRAGDRVTPGQLLVELDDREGVESLRAAEALASQAERERDRARQLRAQGASTEQDLVAAEADCEAAIAQRDRARVLAGHARIRAPSAGVVTERLSEPGDLASPGQPLLRLYDPDRLQLEVPVPVRLLEPLIPGSTHPVRIDGISGLQTASVTEIIAVVDPSSRSRTVKLSLPVFQTPVLPGTFGRLTVEDEARRVIRIPSEAIAHIGQLEQVEVAIDGRITSRLVRSGPAIDGQAEVLSGLNDGEVVVLPVRARE